MFVVPATCSCSVSLDHDVKCQDSFASSSNFSSRFRGYVDTRVTTFWQRYRASSRLDSTHRRTENGSARIFASTRGNSTGSSDRTNFQQRRFIERQRPVFQSTLPFPYTRLSTTRYVTRQTELLSTNETGKRNRKFSFATG